MNALIHAFTQSLMPHLVVVPILLPLLTACLLLLGDRRHRRKTGLAALATVTNLVVAWLLLRWVPWRLGWVREAGAAERMLAGVPADFRATSLGAVLVRTGDATERDYARALADLRDRLRRAGLRPTRQRLSLGWLLFGRGDRHLTAEMLYDEAMRAKVPVSLATVYNTLHQFTEAGLLREVAIEGNKTYFDTKVSDHHHFFIEGENKVIDIPGEGVGIGELPDIPEGMEVVHVDVVVRLRKKS